jgi:hypothetical protein
MDPSNLRVKTAQLWFKNSTGKNCQDKFGEVEHAYNPSYPIPAPTKYCSSRPALVKLVWDPV